MPRAPTLHLLTVKVPAGLAELAAMALIELGASGVEQGTDEPDDALVDTLYAYGTQRRTLLGWARSLSALGSEAGFPCTARVAPAPRSLEAWDVAWTSGLVPVRVSRTLVLAPSTAPVVGVPPEHVVQLEPARAFGFGEHPTTRLAAAAVERLCRDGARTVLDVGTGTGVLSLVASLRGARDVVGIDVDRDAVAVARRNLQLNSPPGQVRFTTLPLPRLDQRFALVVANLEYRTIRSLAPHLARAVAPRGHLVLTGMLGRHARDVEQWFHELGFAAVSRRRTAGGYALLTLARAARGSSARSRGAQRLTRQGTIRRTRSR